MADCRKHGKPQGGLPILPHSLEIPPGFPHFHWPRRRVWDTQKARQLQMQTSQNSQIAPIAVQRPCNGCVRVQDITNIPAHLHEVVSYRMKDNRDSIPPKKMSNWVRRSVTKKMSTPSTSLREPISVEVGTQTPEPSSHDDSARPCIGVSSPCMRRPPRITIHRHQARQS